MPPSKTLSCMILLPWDAALEDAVLHDPMELSINLLDRRAGAAARGAASAAHAAHVRHATAASGLVHLHHDRVHDALELLLLGLELLRLGHLVALKPVQGVLDHLLDLVLIASVEL